ncbi:MAG: hypothetical protein V4576_03305 [Patescibacteria group bacterium]
MKNKVLIVDDEERPRKHHRLILEEDLPGMVETLTAATLEEANRLFDENKDDLILVVMDACLEGSRPDTLPLVHRMRKEGFKGKIIANSSMPEYQQTLLNAGCDQASSGKNELEDDIVEIVKNLLQ